MREILKNTLAALQKLVVCYLTRQKISKILSLSKRSGGKIWRPSREQKLKHKLLWGKYIINVSVEWLKVYGSISEKYDFRYIPEDVYYTEIEPRLNNKAFSKAYTDKNFYHIVLDSEILPEVVLHSTNGVLYSSDYAGTEKIVEFDFWSRGLANGIYVIKPTVDTGGGQGVRVITISPGSFSINPSLTGICSFEELLKYYKRDFLIQKYIIQHPFFAQFNSSSLNTVRILTYRSIRDESIVILHRILRIGKAGSVVDNQASGGIACGIKADGNLSGFGVDKYGNKYFNSNGISFSSVGEILFLNFMIKISIEVAKKYKYSRLLGLDFGVDRDNRILLIEVNDSNNEINFYQMNNGPLFGDYTEEIASFCLKEPKSFVIDFNI